MKSIAVKGFHCQLNGAKLERINLNFIFGPVHMLRICIAKSNLAKMFAN